MIRIVEEGKEWNEWLTQMDSFDFYHTYEYHNIINKKQKEGAPILLTFIDKDTKIGIPFIKRKINKDYFDLTSVHGYMGPVSQGLSHNFDNDVFKKEFVNWLRKERIVSVFSKLNPYIEKQKEILCSLGSIKSVGEIIYFDQNEDNTVQVGKYNRNTRQKIRQLRNTCSVKVAETEDEIGAFIKLYHQSMDKLNAKPIFYFDKEYFKTLLESAIVNSHILLARNNETNDIMGGVFYTKTKEIAHIELACTSEDYLKKSPVRILFDECRLLYKDKGVRYLNLGGGSGGREGSLMRFKSSFTDYFRNFEIWNYIAIPEIYDELVNDWQKKAVIDFFPKYRLKL